MWIRDADRRTRLAVTIMIDIHIVIANRYRTSESEI